MDDITLLSKLQSLKPAEALRPGAEAKKADEQGPAFSEVLKSAIEEVSGLESEADQAIQELITGQNDNIHEAMIALQKADVSFKAMMEVRDKLIGAYKEIMRMQV
ncbi:MAG: flagellar hook-basal body complex protein FliE [Deltaproteobacteria bacterium]|nr:flagellar hook-basal body complex protein FliE [Deltaproteobacteria bacterium]MCB9487242.1 flagellar hook-basal body complex protein FliE [Deltaproteobacteria bacterium]